MQTEPEVNIIEYFTHSLQDAHSRDIPTRSLSKCFYESKSVKLKGV